MWPRTIVVLSLAWCGSAAADLQLAPYARPPEQFELSWVVSEGGSKTVETYSLYARRLTVDISGDPTIAGGRAHQFFGVASAESLRLLRALVADDSIRLPSRATGGAPVRRIAAGIRLDNHQRLLVYGDMPDAPQAPLSDVMALRERLRSEAGVKAVTLPPALKSGAIGVARVVRVRDGDVEIEVTFPATEIAAGARLDAPIARHGEELELFDAKGKLATVAMTTLDVDAFCGTERAVWTGVVPRAALVRPLAPLDALGGVAAFVRFPREDTRAGLLTPPMDARAVLRGDAEGNGSIEALLFTPDACADVTLRAPHGDGTVACCPR